VTEDLKQRLSLAIARARRLEPGKSLLELLESITSLQTRASGGRGKSSSLLSDEELLHLIEPWIIQKKAINKRVFDKTKK
jgi:hypothetical protein